MADDDPHDLQRFVDAQRDSWARALAELTAGEKRSHWMWFVFPQVAGLGSSAMARTYAIASLEEARAYLAHPLLGSRLAEAARAVAAHRGRPAEQVMGGVDALKLRSSMTLFATAAEDPEPYESVLDAFFDGRPDTQTMARLR